MAGQQISRWFQKYFPAKYYADYFLPLVPTPPGPTPTPGEEDQFSPGMYFARKRSDSLCFTDDADVLQMAFNALRHCQRRRGGGRRKRETCPSCN